MPSSTRRPNVKVAYRDRDKLSSLNVAEQSSNVVTQQLYKASHCLKNITSELKVCVAILKDKNASQRNQEDIAHSQKYHKGLSAIVKVTVILNDTGENMDPIGSVKVICDCNKRKKQIQTIDTTNEQKNAGMQMLESYTTMSRAISIICHRDKRACHQYNNVILPSLPIPANRHQYTKPETLEVLLPNDS